MIDLKRLFMGALARHQLRELGFMIMRCRRNEHNWGFAPLFGARLCQNCGDVHPDDENPTSEHIAELWKKSSAEQDLWARVRSRVEMERDRDRVGK